MAVSVLAALPLAAAAHVAEGVRAYESPAAYSVAQSRVAAGSAPGLYTHYDWASGLPSSSDMQVDHVWTTIPDGNDSNGNGVFASSQYWYDAGGAKTGAGYMGSQVMRRGDGTEKRVFIFSCWDADPDHKAMWTADSDANCQRFGGEGVGSHCILDYPVEAGVVYKFKVAPSGHNATGEMWTGTVTDPSGKATKVGTLYYPNLGSVRGFGTLKSTSNMFLEYFVGGDCDTDVATGVGLFGPFFHDRATMPTMAYPSYGSGACKRGEVTACIPMGNGCGKPRIFAQAGKGIVRNNTDQTKLW